jgi:hypothetical protein
VEDFMKPTALFLGALLLAGTALAAGERPESLLGVVTDFDAGKIIFEVASNGCTAKKDFRCDLKDGTLTLVRVRRDSCKAMPQREKIVFTLEELGLSPNKPFALGNKLIVNENLAQVQ